MKAYGAPSAMWRSRPVRLALVGGGLVFGAFVGEVGLMAGLGYVKAVRANALLGEELRLMQHQARHLAEQLDAMNEQSNQLRRLAGLDPYEIPPLTSLAPKGSPRRLNEATVLSLLHTREDIARLDVGTMVLQQAMVEAKQSLRSNIDILHRTPTIVPVQGRITSGYNRARLHPVLRRVRAHEGLDVAARTGEPIVATADGRVTYAGRKGGYGLTIEIDHGRGYRTRYAHASRIEVRVGQTVSRGEIIGRVGSTGTATGPHVHYEVWRQGRRVDPSEYIFQQGTAYRTP
jgi:murein DD-endopeptidase MepM/ murein hydrolase activator NlpD